MTQYDLIQSVKSVGKLVPILKDKDGSIIDGLHRQEIDPYWPSITVEAVDTPVKLELARLAANFCRRNVSSEEMNNRVGFLVKQGLKPEEIADQTGISKSTIYKYMPQKLKDEKKVTAGKVSGVSRSVPSSEQTVKTQETIEPLTECERCHVHNHCKEWHGHWLCPTHYNAAEVNSEGYLGYFRTQEQLKNKKLPELKAPPKPSELDTWETRQARMKVPHSKMEEKIVQGLRARGYKVITDLELCVRKTVPDFNIVLENGKVVRGYIDGQVHNAKRKDKDQQLRDWLRDEQPSDLIVEVDVEGDSDREAEEKLDEIEEAMKF